VKNEREKSDGERERERALEKGSVAQPKTNANEEKHEVIRSCGATADSHHQINLSISTHTPNVIYICHLT